MKRDDMNNLELTVVEGPIALDADTTPAAIDLAGCDSATIDIAVGIGGVTFTADNKIEFEVEHCDTADGSYAAVAAGDIVLGSTCDASVGTGGIVKTLNAAHAAAAHYKCAYIGGKRFLKIKAEFSGSHGTATPIAITVIKSRLHLAGQS